MTAGFLLSAMLLSSLHAPLPEAKPVVMVLGTYHMANPGLDAVKVSQRDTLGADRQGEIADLVSRLKKFRPNKVLVERVPEKQADLDRQFAAFLAGTQPLASSEVQQVGFRLAKDLGLEALTGVDYPSGMDFGKVFGFAAQNGMPDLPGKYAKIFAEIGKLMTDWDAKYSVGELLALHNNPEFQQKSHSFYLEMLQVAKGDEYPGADLVAAWYRRNLVIYENIRSGLKPGDRALVIFGSGHAYLLNRLLFEGGKVTVEPAAKYLPKPPKVSLPDIG